jgi:hypothetical protein
MYEKWNIQITLDVPFFIGLFLQGHRNDKRINDDSSPLLLASLCVGKTYA